MKYVCNVCVEEQEAGRKESCVLTCDFEGYPPWCPGFSGRTPHWKEDKSPDLSLDDFLEKIKDKPVEVKMIFKEYSLEPDNKQQKLPNLEENDLVVVWDESTCPQFARFSRYLTPEETADGYGYAVKCFANGRDSMTANIGNGDNHWQSCQVWEHFRLPSSQEMERGQVDEENRESLT